MINKNTRRIKKIIKKIPFSAEMYWLLRRKDTPTATRFSLQGLSHNLPEIIADLQEIEPVGDSPKAIFLFASMHLWMDIGVLTSLALSAYGHDVTFGYYPYMDWFTDQPKIDLRRQHTYAQQVLKPTTPYIKPVSLLSSKAAYLSLPVEITKAVKQVSGFDTQYTLQIEEIDEEAAFYKFRYKRNLETAQTLLYWLQKNKPDLVIVPNGTVLEFGIVYRVAKYLKIPVVTFEFSDKHEAMWIGQNEEIMQQNTSDMWNIHKDEPLNKNQLKQIQNLLQSRQEARTTENFTRKWQKQPSQGGEAARKQLKLDDRPVVLMATNVLGDSLTIGRQAFSQTMSDWVVRTIQYFLGRPDIQLLIRIHPGEAFTKNKLSMVDIIQQTLPEFPENVHLIGPEESISTYDLIDITDVGLVYTTTVGLEMALRGIPVIVSGKTHYRERGFTLDPNSWVEYFKLLGNMLIDPKPFKLDNEKIELAWRYAYHFFYSYPLPYPWHIRLWQDYETHKMDHVMSAEGIKKFGNTFRYLTGKPIDWTNNHKGDSN